MIRTRTVLAGVALCAAAALAAGCSSSSPAPAAGGSGSGGNGVVTLTYWSGFTGGDQATYVALIKMFNATHKDIQVNMTVQPWDSIAQKLPEAMATGAGPDIATPDYNVGTIRQYISNGLMAPIDSLLGSGTNQVPGRGHPARHQVRLHGQRAPVCRAGELGHPGALLQQDPVRQGGDRRPPKTMAAAPAGRGQADGQVRLNGSSSTGWPSLITLRSPCGPSSYGPTAANILNANGCSDLDSPKTVSGRQQLGQPHRQGPDHAGRAWPARTPTTCSRRKRLRWRSTALGRSASTCPHKVNFGLAPVPVGAIGRPVTTASTVPMVLNAKSKNMAAALTFFAWWMSKPAQAGLAEGVGYPPSRTDMANYPGLTKNPYVAGFCAAEP